MAPEDSHDLAALLARVAAQDRKAFALLYRLQAPPLYRILLRTLRRESLAEEALQDVFVKIWQRAGDYRADRGAPSTWLGSIARYRALDLLRRSRETLVETDELYDPADESPGPMDLMAASSRTDALKICLKKLKAGQRDCLVLCYCEGYTQEELSAKLQTPLGTVKSWIRRGLTQLRQCLAQLGA
jgi:RNA polymerase sigma-70 factor (ECF subfamily)